MSEEEIREKKLEELKHKIIEQQEKEKEEKLQFQQEIATLEAIAKQYMTKEAIARYGNVKVAHQEVAVQALLVIVKGVQSGKLHQKLDDAGFKDLLKQITGTKKETKIRRI